MSKKSKFLEPLAVAVAGGSSIKDAADIAGCATRTAYNISATDEFRSAVALIRTEITAQAVGKLTEGATQAADTMVQLLGEEHEPSIRLAASKAILGAVVSVSEFGELRERLDNVERQDQLRIVS